MKRTMDNDARHESFSLAPGFSRVYGSGIEEVGGYIARQEEHHLRRSFAEELKQLVERYGLEWHKEENR